MTSPVRPAPTVLALGVNLGDREATLRSALAALASTPGLTPERVSPVVETAAVGGPDQPDYLNAVLLARTTLQAGDLLAACQEIEVAHHRERTVRWGPRTLDIDIVDYAATISDDPELTLPHPRAHQRAFVLVPWSRVDPEAVLVGPCGGPVSELASRADDLDTTRVTDIDLSTALTESAP